MGVLRQYQVFYFPYLFLNKNTKIEFDNIVIWSFDNLKYRKDYISDTILRDKIKRLIKTNIDFNNKPIHGIGIVTINGKTYTDFNDDEKLQISEIRTIFFLSVVSSNLTQSIKSFCYTADNFELVQQNFILEDDTIGFVNGAIIGVADTGYNLRKFRYSQPKFLPKPLNFQIDIKLILRVINLKKRHKRLYMSIIQSSEIFFHAYKNSLDVSWFSRILLQMPSI